MDNSIYEVERDDYVGFIGQLNKQMMDVEQAYKDDSNVLSIYSKATGKHLCTRIISQDVTEKYYVINMPEDNERIAPKRVRQIKLETKEEVQAFFDALNKIQKEKKND